MLDLDGDMVSWVWTFCCFVRSELVISELNQYKLDLGPVSLDG